MLTLYSIDRNNHFLKKYNYISDANAFITYLPIAEKFLDSTMVDILYSITSKVI